MWRWDGGLLGGVVEVRRRGMVVWEGGEVQTGRSVILLWVVLPVGVTRGCRRTPTSSLVGGCPESQEPVRVVHR